ncbi:MAG: hypothetical protein Q7S74_06035 [Nanoarchaeota archaeon]|nr:hypothetical protein [Nanoarchaeota archaeon]
MVLQGYGSSLSEQDAREEEDWKLNQSRTLLAVPDEDVEVLMKKYQEVTHNKLRNTPKIFIKNLGWRAYTEWCTSGESSWSEHTNYCGQALIKFIDDETIYAAKRVNEKGLSVNDIRNKVLEAIVKRGVELFSDWDGESYPKSDKDKRNLRTSLEPYIGF